jgi:type II restriction enzyme
MNYTVANLAKAFSKLRKNVWFDYVSVRTGTQVRIKDIVLPEGPIFIERKVNGTITAATISISMMRRVCNFIEEGKPLNLDRILGASYNTRSALESLMAHTSEFYWCLPGRIEQTDDGEMTKRGHKHLIWLPSLPHKIGVLLEHEMSQMAISELPVQSILYEALTISDDQNYVENIEEQRRHIQMQVLLAYIGKDLGYRTWIANNDRNHLIQGKRIAEIEGVIESLQNEKVLASYSEAIRDAMLIDCIWFKNGRLMPAVIEVEHSTGVTSGLTRMKRFQDSGPALQDIRWVIAGPDDSRSEVIRKASVSQFSSLNIKFFPYSAIEELFDLCKRRKISNDAITEKFLDCFIEDVLAG